MVEEYKTSREVALAIDGLKDRLGFMIKVFVGAALIFTGCFGYFFYTTATTSITIERVEASSTGIEQRFVNVV